MSDALRSDAAVGAVGMAAVVLSGAAQAMKNASAATLAIVWNCFLQFAMALNMKEGKTAFLPLYGGQGQEKARAAELLLDKNLITGTPLLPCPHARGENVMLRIVKRYSHMGVKTTAIGSFLLELQSRHGSTVPFVHRLTWQYFRKTSTCVEKN